MLRRLALASLAPLILAAAPDRSDAQRPTMPRVRPEPCEGYCKKVWATCTRITLRSSPSDKAPVAAVLDSGLRVAVLDGQMRTVSPGIVVVRRTFTFVDQVDGEDGPVTLPDAKRWRLAAGDTVYVVDRISDGDSYASYIWIYRGREAETGDFWLEPEYAELRPQMYRSHRAPMVAPLKQEWWVQVRGPKGQTGWTQPGPEWTGTSYYDDPAEKCAK